MLVSGTGSGKTAAFLLPAMMRPEKQIVVICPLVSLTQDLQRRVDQLGLQNVLLISSSQFGTKDSIDSIHSLYHQGKLHLVVVDEVHSFVSSAGYRAFQEETLTMRAAPFPMLLLSATVPIEMEQKVKQMLKNQNLITIRGDPIRRNLVYEERRGEKRVDVVVEELRTLKEEERAIVYVRSKKEAEDVCSELNESKFLILFFYFFSSSFGCVFFFFPSLFLSFYSVLLILLVL